MHNAHILMYYWTLYMLGGPTSVHAYIREIEGWPESNKRMMLRPE